MTEVVLQIECFKNDVTDWFINWCSCKKEAFLLIRNGLRTYCSEQMPVLWLKPMDLKTLVTICMQIRWIRTNLNFEYRDQSSWYYLNQTLGRNKMTSTIFKIRFQMIDTSDEYLVLFLYAICMGKQELQLLTLSDIDQSSPQTYTAIPIEIVAVHRGCNRANVTTACAVRYR